MQQAAETPIKVRYSQADPEALRIQLCDRYPLQEPVRCELVQNGMNDVYKVYTGEANYYLRISLAGAHRLADIEDEVAVIRHLAGDGLKVAVPVAGRDGADVWAIRAPEGTRYAVLFTEAEDNPSQDQCQCYWNLGCAVARMHRSIDSSAIVILREPWDDRTLITRPLALLKPYLAHRVKDYTYLADSAADIWTTAGLAEKAPPYFGFCHGDIQPSNFFFADSEPVLFDFDGMGMGWRAYDIAVFAMNMGTWTPGFLEQDVWKAFIGGYESIRKLEEWERRSIPGFAALHALRVMWHHADLRARNSDSHFYCTDPYFDSLIQVFKTWYDRFKAGIS